MTNKPLTIDPTIKLLRLIEQTRERLARYDKSHLLGSQAERLHAYIEQSYYAAVLAALRGQLT